MKTGEAPPNTGFRMRYRCSSADAPSNMRPAAFETERAGLAARPFVRLAWGRRLPVAAGRATAAGRLFARTRRRAVVRFRDQELGPRVRRAGHDVALTADSGVDLAVGVADRQARGVAAELAVSRRHAVRESVLVGETSLDLRHQVARVGLRRSVLALLLLAQEGRQSDRGKDADDQDDDEELDQGEPALL